MGEICDNVTNYIECRLHDSDDNTNLILFNPKFLPTPQTKLKYNNNSKSPNCNSGKTVTKFQPAKDKDSSTKGELKKKSVGTASAAPPEPVLANADSGATGTYL